MASNFVIDVYSHHVAVTGFSKQGKDALLDFCATRVGQKGLVFLGGGNYTMKLIKLFAASTKNRREFRFHRNQLNELHTFLKNRFGDGVDIEVRQHFAKEGQKVVFKLNKKFTARDYQIPIVDYLSTGEPAKLVNIQPGKGKLQPLYSKIKIPYGWTTMGEIKRGDRVVAKDGTTCNVIDIYPQGIKDIYRVTFGDGRYTDCGADHLWRVFYKNTTIKQQWRVVNTLEVIRLLSMSDPRVYIDLCSSEQCADIDLPMDPYVLGVLIGDGGMSSSGLTLSTPDSFIREYISDNLPESLNLIQANGSSIDYRISGNGSIGGNPWILALKKLGLHGKRAWEKFIPEVFLHGSSEQRWSLLQGLMDTDGTITTAKSSSYSTTSLKLAEDVRYLVRSLGDIASISERNPTYSYKGQKLKGRKAYQVNIRSKTPSNLFRLPKKKDRTDDNNQYSPTLKLKIKDIRYIGKEETQCIAIDHPEHLYVTDDFIVTHNTFTAASAISNIQQRTAIVIKGMYVDKWISDVKELLGLKPGELLVVRGSKDLKRLIDLAKSDQLKAQVIIITNKTIYNFIKEYEHSSGCSDLYGCKPQELYKVLGVGVRLIDEVHQDFHLNFKQDLYSHVYTTIDLSATIDVDDPFIERMYRLKYPIEMRYSGLEYDKYISVTALFYRLYDENMVRYIRRGMNSYSHVDFEKSIMKRKRLLVSYLNLIEQAVKAKYLSRRQGPQKLLVFASTVELCKIVADDIRRYSGGLTVGTYVAEDDYDALMNNVITVSTQQSAGTAVDIPDLRITICTTAINSRQANEQMMGRLRRMKNYPDITPEFYYFCCEDISKHLEYHQKKMENFKDKVLSHTVAYLRGGL